MRRCKERVWNLQSQSHLLRDDLVQFGCRLVEGGSGVFKFLQLHLLLRNHVLQLAHLFFDFRAVLPGHLGLHQESSSACYRVDGSGGYLVLLEGSLDSVDSRLGGIPGLDSLLAPTVLRGVLLGVSNHLLYLLFGKTRGRLDDNIGLLVGPFVSRVDINDACGWNKGIRAGVEPQ
jgi:hypothetical protein